MMSRSMVNAVRRVRVAGLVGSIVVVAVLATTGVSAQPASNAKKSADDMGPPEPKDVDLTTDDGLLMKATYYAGTKGEETVPVIILHDYKGDRGQYKELALDLQSKGYAVMVPDLRGHGASTELRPPGQTKSTTILPKRLNKTDLQLMVEQDLWSVNRFLREKNNAKELNIEKLCVIGVGGMGSLVALNWAVLDGSQPVLPSYKPGQYVKALVLISPEWAVRGATVAGALDDPRVKKELSIMILVGDKTKSALQASEKIYGRISRFHPKPAPKDERRDKTLFYFKKETPLEGAKFVNQPEFKVFQYISEFIAARLVEKSFPWEDHTRP